MKTKTRSRLLMFGLLVVLLAVAGLFYQRHRDDADTVTVSAMFADAYPMVPGSRVRLAGVQVGTVDDIVAENGMARVIMKLDREVLPIHTDARATIIIQDLLGERFVGLDRGSANAPVLPEGATLRDTQTNRVTDLQDVLNSMDDPTSVALAGLITTSGEGLSDNGQNTSDTLKALAPTMHRTDQLVKLLNQQNAQLNQLIDNAQPVASAFASNHGQDLDRLVDSTTNLLGTVGAQQQQLRDTMVQLPGTLASARRTLNELAGVAGPTAEDLADIRPTTDNLVDIAHELKRFSLAAEPSADALADLLPKVDHLLRQARPVVSDLQRAGPDVRDTTASFKQLDATALSHLTDLLELAKGWTLATTDYDAISHYFKAIVSFGPAELRTIGLGIVPGAPRNPLPAVPLPSPPEPPYNKIGKQVEPEGPGDPRYSKPTGSTGNDGATGLTSKQESSMVQQMLGRGSLGGGN
jgi:phospholipid/cholesterol/gamma-HCH transport system substrate-binding protein